MKDTVCEFGPISGGCFTTIVAPDGTLLGEPLRSGEGVVIADLDFTLIDRRKILMELGRPLQPAGIAQSPDRPHAYCARS
jgi:predicted amidohydrolase